MKNLYSKNEFVNLRSEEQLINEGLFNMIGKLFSKITNYIKKIKGGQEVENIYNKYLAKIDEDIKKKTQVDLSLTAEEQLKNQSTKNNVNPVTTTTTTVSTNESVRVHIKNKLNEADVINSIKNAANTVKDTIAPDSDTEKTEAETNVKMTIQALKDKGKLMQQIIDTNAEIAKNEMNRVLTKYGGSAKNPKLAIIIANKIDQFKLAFLNAKIKIYDNGGDKSASLAVAKDRDILSKQLDEKWNKLSEPDKKIEDLKVGDTVKYMSKTQNKEVEEKIIKIDGDILTFNGAKGEFTKNKNEVTKSQPAAQPAAQPVAPTEYKVGDKITWTSEADKKVYTRTLTKVDGDTLTFKEGDNPDGKELTKKAENVKKVEAQPAAK